MPQHEVHAMFLCDTETHCEWGKAIGRPGRVIKVKLLPPRLFLPVWWDNKRGSPCPLLFHTRPACLSDLLIDYSNSIQTRKEFLLPAAKTGIIKDWQLGITNITHQIYFRWGLQTRPDSSKIVLDKILCFNIVSTMWHVSIWSQTDKNRLAFPCLVK